nr:metallophosphoesterase [Candidatus Sigynarchaeota archaeon]
MSKTISSIQKHLIGMLVISGVIFSSFLMMSVATNKISLLRPRWNVPTLRLVNETITIEANLDFPLAQVDSFSATITSPFGSYPLVIDSISLNLNSISVIASFPSNVTEDVLYDLEINMGGFHDEQKHAVKVLSSYKTEFKVIVWADTQVGYSEEYDDVWEMTYEWIEEMVNQANLINPEFVLLVGDITETALKSEYQFMYNQCMRLNVPVFVGTGNHDYYGTAEYKRWCQYTNFTFDYGPDYHVVYLDTGMNLDALRDQYFDWLADDLALHASTPVKIVAGHAPPYQCNNNDMTRINKNFEHLNEEVVQLLAQQEVAAYLYGHDHKDKINFGNCTPVPAGAPIDDPWYIQTASGREEGAYRVLHFKDRQMVNVTALVNASTGERAQATSFRVYPRWEDKSTPAPVIPYLGAETNVSSVNNPLAQAVTSIDCNVTNRFSEEYFEGITVRFNILSATDPATFFSSNASAS